MFAGLSQIYTCINVHIYGTYTSKMINHGEIKLLRRQGQHLNWKEKICTANSRSRKPHHEKSRAKQFGDFPLSGGILPLKIGIVSGRTPPYSPVLTSRIGRAGSQIHDRNVYISTNNYLQYLIKNRYTVF